MRRLYDVCSGLVFKFGGSEKISPIWKTLMQVWIIGYHGSLCEAVGLFVNGSDEAELYFLFQAKNYHFSS